MTITFNKPIIKPPIEIEEIIEEERRGLIDLVPVKELLNITVVSDYYEDDSEKVKIDEYAATRLTSRALDI